MFLPSSQIIFLFINILFVSTQAATDETCPSGEQNNSSIGFNQAGYLPDYRVNSFNLNEAALHLTDIILFSIEPDQNGSISDDVCCLNSNHYHQVRNAREYKLKKEDEIFRYSVTNKITAGGEKNVCENEFNARKSKCYTRFIKESISMDIIFHLLLHFFILLIS